MAGAGPARAVAACRACLQREGELHIFREPRLLHKLRACAPLQIDVGDGLPNSLCKLCMTNLDQAYNFQQLCIQSDLSLRQTFLKKENDIKCEVEESVETGGALEYQDYAEFLVPMQIKKENESENSNVTSILEKIGLSGEIKIKTVDATFLNNELKGKITSSKKHNGKKKNKKEGSIENFERNVDKKHVSDDAIYTGINKGNMMHISIERESSDVPNLTETNASYSCKYCEDVIFADNEKRDEHLAMHRKETYDCVLCKKTFKGRVRIDIHKSSHANMMVTCEYCGKTIKRCNMTKHLRLHKTPQSKQCPICHKILSDNHFKKHVDSHNSSKKYICNICSAGFYWKNSFVGHLRRHTGEKPFKCQYCESTFTLVTTKVQHERLHTGETPFRCPLCNKGFAQRCNMKSHFVHNHREHNYKEEIQKAKDRQKLEKSAIK